MAEDEYLDDDDIGYVTMAVVRPGEFVMSELQTSNDDTDSTRSVYGYHRHDIFLAACCIVLDALFS
jgi:hypothetical protein